MKGTQRSRLLATPEQTSRFSNSLKDKRRIEWQT
jgi:hypothetical protein